MPSATLSPLSKVRRSTAPPLVPLGAAGGPEESVQITWLDDLLADDLAGVVDASGKGIKADEQRVEVCHGALGAIGNARLPQERTIQVFNFVAGE
jgi:hypothetical protein